MFSGQPLGAVLSEMQPELLKLREQAYQLLGQQAASLGTGGAGTGGENKDTGKKQPPGVHCTAVGRRRVMRA